MTDVEFGSLFKFIRNGKSVRQQADAGGIPISRIETISLGVIDPSRVGYAGLDIDEGRGWLLEQGDILFSHINSVEHVGKCAIYQGLPDQLIHGMNLLCLRPDQSKISPSFAMKLMRTPAFRGQLSNFINKAVNQASVSTTNLKAMRVSVPALDKQRRIAAILDQAEALRTKRRQALAKLDTLTQSLFLEMFGDPVANSLNWPSLSVDQLCTLVRGSSPRPQGDSRYYGGTVPRLMVADVTRDGWLVTPAIDSLTEAGAALSRPVPKGTVVMAVSGNVGVVSQLAVPACIHDGFVGFTKLKNDLIQPYFLTIVLHLLKQTHGQRKAGAIFQNLTTTDIKAMCLPVPPMPQQLLFVERCAVVSRNVALSRKSDSKVDDLIVSLQRRAFRGEL